MKSRQQIAKCIGRLGTDSAFEVFAKAKKLGMWSMTFQYPWDFRKGL